MYEIVVFLYFVGWFTVNTKQDCFYFSILSFVPIQENLSKYFAADKSVTFSSKLLTPCTSHSPCVMRRKTPLSTPLSMLSVQLKTGGFGLSKHLSRLFIGNCRYVIYSIIPHGSWSPQILRLPFSPLTLSKNINFPYFSLLCQKK